MVQYLHFRILKFPLNLRQPQPAIIQMAIPGGWRCLCPHGVASLWIQKISKYFLHLGTKAHAKHLFFPHRFPEQLRLAGFDLHENSVRLVSLYHSRIRTPDVHSYPPTNNHFSEGFTVIVHPEYIHTVPFCWLYPKQIPNHTPRFGWLIPKICHN